MKNLFRKSVEDERSTKKMAFVHHKGGKGKMTRKVRCRASNLAPTIMWLNLLTVRG